MGEDKTLQERISALVESGVNVERGDLMDLFSKDELEPPANRIETKYLEFIADYVPTLLQAGIPTKVVQSYIFQTEKISNDPRNQDGGSVDARAKYTGWYMFLLAHDLIELRKAGLNDDGMKAFLQYATRTCFVGRFEHDHIPEQQRENIYTHLVNAIKSELAEKRPSFMKDQQNQVRQMFEHAVYGDNISGISEFRVYKGNLGDVLRNLL